MVIKRWAARDHRQSMTVIASGGFGASEIDGNRIVFTIFNQDGPHGPESKYNYEMTLSMQEVAGFINLLAAASPTAATDQVAEHLKDALPYLLRLATLVVEREGRS